MPLPLFSPRRRRAAAAALLALVLTGCAAAESTASNGTTEEPATSADAPVAIVNCGFEAVFDEAPERVVTIKSTSTEMLLALGLGERIVGTAFQDGPVAAGYEDAAAGIPVIAERVPSQEVVLEAEPDLVYVGWESNLTADGAGDRAELAELGVGSYVSAAACQSVGQPPKLDFDDIFAEIDEVASIFRVDASELIAQQRAELAAIEPSEAGLSALWFSSGSDTPYVGAGIGAPQLILETIGLENIAADVAATWSPFSWEAVIDAEPDVIVLVDAAWNTAENKIGILEDNPATANLDAVVEARYLIVPFPASEAGVRSVEAAVSLTEQLEALDIP